MECIYLNIAVPLQNGQLSSQFRDCDQFKFYEIDSRNGRVLDRTTIDAPPQAPEKLPGWLRDRGIHVVIVQEIDKAAIDQLENFNLKVINHVAEIQPDQIISQYIGERND